MSSFGDSRSALANMTFCWLPPLNEPISDSVDAVLIDSRSTQSARLVDLRPAAAAGRRRKCRPTSVIVMFSRTFIGGTVPRTERSAGTNATPARIAWRGW